MKNTKLIQYLGLATVGAAMLLAPLVSTAQPPAAGQGAQAPGQGPGGPGGRGGPGGGGGRGGGRGRGIQIDAAAMDALFKKQCETCHEQAERAPPRDELKQRTADNVIEVLTNGAMKAMASNLSPTQVRDLSIFLTGRQPGEALPVAIKDVACVGPDTPLKITPTSWTKIAGDDANTAYQKNPGLKATDLPKLKLKWAFSFRASSYGQPIVVGDHLFLTSGSGGGFYSMDAKSGCVHWKVDDISSRTTPMILNRPDLAPSGWVTFLAHTNGNLVSSFDAQTGKKLWTSKSVETVGASHLTGTPALYQNILYVPVSGAEEGRTAGMCCTFRGSLVALDAKTGAILWQTYFINEPRTPTRVNRDGIQLQGPAGAAAWSSPTVDAKRHQVIVTTGNSTTDGATKGADAVIAIDLTSGKINWSTQTYENDNFLVGCTRPPVNMVKAPNCPEANGPDYDYGASAIIATVGGKDILLTGQKSGVAHAIDAKTGKRLWDNQVGAGSSLGGIEWGMATDGKYLFAANSDIIREQELALQAAGQMSMTVKVPKPVPGLTAIDIATGKTVWHYDTPQLPCKWAPGTTRGREPGCYHGQSQAVTAIPGAVFSGSTNGYFRAFDAKTGKVLWDYDTTGQTYDTINGVKGQPGGSVDSMGATVSNGMVYVMSGYAGSAGNGNNNPNVLLAFSVDGK